MRIEETRIVVAGFGGQGVMLAGGIIAQAAMFQGRNVTMMLSYGAEMRGGTANSTVVVSDGEIASPVIETPDVAVLLNQPSLDRFEDSMAPGGRLILNRSLIDAPVRRDDLEVTQVRASEIAHGLGSVRAANMVAVGAFARATGLLEPERIAEAIRFLFDKKGSKVVNVNLEAMEKGMEAVEA